MTTQTKTQSLILGKYGTHPGATVTEHLNWVRKEIYVGPAHEDSVNYVLMSFKEALEELQKLGRV